MSVIGDPFAQGLQALPLVRLRPWGQGYKWCLVSDAHGPPGKATRWGQDLCPTLKALLLPTSAPPRSPSA